MRSFTSFLGRKSSNFRSKVMAALSRDENSSLQLRNVTGVSNAPYSVLGFLQVILVGFVTAMTVMAWFWSSKHAHHSVATFSNNLQSYWINNMKLNMISILESTNVSAVHLANLLSSNGITEDLASYSRLENQVNPALFLVYSTNPHASHAFFLGKTGLFTSYHLDSKETFMLFSNTTNDQENVASVEVSLKGKIWYRQPVNSSTGVSTGEAAFSNATVFWSESWLREALENNQGLAALGVTFTETKELLFLLSCSVKNTVDLNPEGVAALGVPAKTLFNTLQSDSSRSQMYLATDDGYLIAQTGSPYHVGGGLGTPLLIKATESDNVVVAGAAMHLNRGKTWDNEDIEFTNVEIEGVTYVIDYTTVHLAGKPLLLAVIIPHNSIWDHITISSRKIWTLLISLCVTIFTITILFICCLTRAATKEMQLRAALIQQLEARKKAERMNNRKSMAFAQVSHDLRTSIAAIIGLINASHSNASEGSEMELNLLQMKSCASDFLGFLNSILDSSKIEAGKFQLEEIDFNIVQVLEEVVDTFAVLALQKDIEVILDLPEEYVGKELWVNGDVCRLQQILFNLLSNALKFTTEGHVVLRFWVKQVVPRESLLLKLQDSGPRTFMKLFRQTFTCFFNDTDICRQVYGHFDAGGEHSYVNLQFEVDDTGKGIPKDAHKVVFEDFVQGDKLDKKKDGTGLGLGIVKSLVHLMKGEIDIVDKNEPGERGTCFRFNLLFRLDHEKLSSSQTKNGEQFSSDEELDDPSHQTTFGSSSGAGIWNRNHGLKSHISQSLSHTERISAIIVMHGEMGKSILRNWLERQGIPVMVLGNWEDIALALEKLRQEVVSKRCDSDSCDSISKEHHFSDRYSESVSKLPFTFDFPSTIGVRKHSGTHSLRSSVILLMEISMIVRNLKELSATLSCFFPSTLMSYKVVCLAAKNTSVQCLQELRQSLAQCELILYKPIHGSRLHAIREVVLELNGKKSERDSSIQSLKPSQHIQPNMATHEIVSCNEPTCRPVLTKGDQNAILNIPEKNQRIRCQKPLSGRTFLVAEDNMVLQQIAKSLLEKLGADVECVDNGVDAVRLVSERFQNIVWRNQGSVSKEIPSSSSKGFRMFDILLMDCEMPEMNGYEATKKIREVEIQHGYHVTIIALTANTAAEGEIKCLEAGMDFHLTKPLNVDSLLNAIGKLLC